MKSIFRGSHEKLLSLKTKLVAAIAALSILAVVAVGQAISTNYAAGVATVYYLDPNGVPLFQATATASAVNNVQFVNSATGVAPQVKSTGSDTNIGLALTPKGTGLIALNNGTDPTKQVLVSVSGGTTATATTLAFSHAANITLNMPANSGGVPTGCYTRAGLPAAPSPAGIRLPEPPRTSLSA